MFWILYRIRNGKVYMIPYINRSGWVKDSIFLVHQVLFWIYSIGRGDDMQTKLEGAEEESNSVI